MSNIVCMICQKLYMEDKGAGSFVYKPVYHNFSFKV